MKFFTKNSYFLLCATTVYFENSAALPDKQGDKAAFGRLYNKYAPVLLELINRILPADSDGEEILQTVFLHI